MTPTPVPDHLSGDLGPDPVAADLAEVIETTITTDDPRRPVQETFADLGVLAATVEALDGVGITHPFAIQALTLPLALAGDDLIGQARTGTGKTLAFGIPILQRVVGPRDDGAVGLDGRPQALVVVPTRELCVQVTGDIAIAGSTRGVRVLSVYGGRSYEPQVAALKTGVEVVVGTPGRLLDLARQGALQLGGVRVLVLDEADEMLDLGFLPDVERILEHVPARRQTMLFSATMPAAIVGLARRFMVSPVHVRAEEPDANRTVPTTAQHVFRAHNLDKLEMVARILQARGRALSMIFCRTKRTCDKVAAELEDRGFAAAAVHGDLPQGVREQTLRAFRSGKIDVLVATDVAARGIDVAGVTHVVNYQCPEDEKTYLHRIGRTGRAGGDGVAVTLVDWDDLHRWGLINQALELPFGDPPETYSTSPHLLEALDIPAGTKGRLPRAARTRAGLDAEAIEDIGDTGSRRSRTPLRAGGRAGAGTSGSPASSGRGDPADVPADRPPGRSRARQRTRGGGNAGTPAAPAGAAGTGSAAAPGPAGGSEAGGRPTGGELATGEPGRRRRRRGGRGRGQGEDGPAATSNDIAS